MSGDEEMQGPEVRDEAAETQAYLASLSALLLEWESAEDEAAYDPLPAKDVAKR